MKTKALFLLFAATILSCVDTPAHAWGGPSADAIYDGRVMAVSSDQDVRYPLDTSKPHYLFLPQDSDSIETRNLFPVVENSLRRHNIHLTTNKNAAAYWIMCGVESAVTGADGNNPLSGKVFVMVIFLNRPEGTKVWDIHGSVADTPRLDSSSIINKLLDHYGSNFKGWDKVHLK